MEKVQPEINESPTQSGWLATGGLIGGLLASTCCIAPLILVLMGVGGAWVGNLTALAPYQWFFVAIALVCLGAGFWHVYYKPKIVCVEGSYCATPNSNSRLVKLLKVSMA